MELGPLAADHKPHALCIPFPAQGHISPMLKLAKLLHTDGFHISFVNTEYNHNRLLKSRGPSSLSGLPDFRFETIPDGLPPTEVDGTQDVLSLIVAITTKCLAPFRQLLSKLIDPLSDSPPVSCIISDGVISFTLDAAKEFGIPEVLFWTTSACGFMGYLQYKHLIQKGLVPFKDEDDYTNGYLDTPIDWVPGMPNMRLRDFPTFIRTTDPEDIMLNTMVSEAHRASMASAIILNTIPDLERPVLDTITSILHPPIYTIGPLALLSDHLPESLSSIGSNLWKEDTSVISWLQGKQACSVIYVNFGSITVMTNEQLVEFAWGLANSSQDFLWVIRPDLVKGDSAVLPPEFGASVGNRGILASWCPQEEVLRHPAVGGFLTHSGWNSTLESLSAGVPMLCWPFFAEQQTNCRFACTVWGVGMEIDNDVKRGQLEGLIRELMGGEKGKEMRRRALEWKDTAARATQVGGASFVNLEKLVNDVLLVSRP